MSSGASQEESLHHLANQHHHRYREAHRSEYDEEPLTPMAAQSSKREWRDHANPVTLYHPVMNYERLPKRTKLDWSDESEEYASFVGVKWLSSSEPPDRDEIAQIVTRELTCPMDHVLANCPWLHCPSHFWRQDHNARPAPDPLSPLFHQPHASSNNPGGGGPHQGLTLDDVSITDTEACLDAIAELI